MTQINNPISIIGMSIITSNEEAFKHNSIGLFWGEFFKSNLKQNLIGSIISEKIYAAYSDYENEDKGKYRLTIGYAVKQDSSTPEGLTNVIIPAGDYKKYQCTNQVEEIVATWKTIWETKKSKFPRNFVADFEEYDDKSVSIYIGLDHLAR